MIIAKWIKTPTLCAVAALALLGCGKSGDEDLGTSFHSSTKADFPECTSKRSGYLAYAADESKFYTCDGSSWTEASIKGAKGDTGTTGATGTAGTGATSVYNASGTKIGTVAFAQWPMVEIKFSDSGSGMFYAGGAFASGLCKNSFCTLMSLYTPTPPGAATLSFGNVNLDNTNPRSYLLYTTSTCSGTPYLPDQPIKHSVFMGPTNAFYKASGSESTSTIAPVSIYLHDRFSCTNTAFYVTAAGVCCSLGTVSTASYYSVAATYTMPSAVPSYPFSGPLYFE